MKLNVKRVESVRGVVEGESVEEELRGRKGQQRPCVGGERRAETDTRRPGEVQVPMFLGTGFPAGLASRS